MPAMPSIFHCLSSPRDATAAAAAGNPYLLLLCLNNQNMFFPNLMLRVTHECGIKESNQSESKKRHLGFLFKLNVLTASGNSVTLFLPSLTCH